MKSPLKSLIILINVDIKGDEPMLRIMISDDEINICNLIKSMIDWNQMGLELVAMTQNGLSTYDKIVELHPDIVITDIKMPVMDELEVIKRTREENIDVKYIVISGFSDFKYAYTALKYGVEDFLLKPIDENELRASLEKTILSIMSSKARTNAEYVPAFRSKDAYLKVRRIFVTSFFSGLQQCFTNDINKINSEFYFSFSDGLFQLIQLIINEQGTNSSKRQLMVEKLMEQISSLCFDVEYVEGPCNVSFLLNYSSANATAVDAIFNFLPSRIFQESLSYTLCIGTPCSMLEKMDTSVIELKRIAESRIVFRSKKILRSRDVPGLDKSPQTVKVDLNMPEFEKALEIMDFDRFDNLISEFINDRSSQIIRFTPGLAYIFLCNVCSASAELFNRIFPDDEISWDSDILSDSLYSSCSFDEIKVHVLNEIHEMGASVQRKRGSMTKKLMIVKKYVNDHYTEHIELDDVAKLVYLSPAYLGKLFKQKTGMCFSDYVLQVRMDAAKEMLRDMEYNISEIAVKLGYREARYFSKFFKKYTGVNPSDYRKLYQI